MEQSLKILIVDDDEYVLDALCCFLNNKDYDVIPAPDGIEGLTLFENDPNGFDLIITDLVMPKMSGMGLISVIKKKLPDTPVIAMTGWGGVSRGVCHGIPSGQGIVKTISIFPS